MSAARQSCAIIVPVFNEERAIEETVRRIKATCAQIPGFLFEVICVNDGSTDATSNILAQTPGITVLTHDANRGYGAALRTGLDYTRREWVSIVDADGTYPLEDLAPLLAGTGSEVAMVVGTRMGEAIARGPFRRMARWILRKMVHGLTGTMVPDLNSGMRVFQRSLYLEFRHLLPLGFSFTTTLTVASLYSGYKVLYIPIRFEHRIGRSNIKPVRDFLGFAMLIVRLASYFEPLRFFLPLAFGLLLLGVVRGVRDIVLTNALGGLSLILVFMALQMFALGVIADVIVRRFQVPPDAASPSRPDDSIRVTTTADTVSSRATQP